MTPFQLTLYYANLLIKQYKQKPKAFASIQSVASLFILPQVSTQDITFSSPPTSGTYTLTYNGSTTTPLGFASSDVQVQTALQALPGLSQVTVSSLVITMTGVNPPALLISGTSSLTNALGSVSIQVIETDVTLPLALNNAFNLTGPQTATGVQLDILAKYQNVTRTGFGTNGQAITLSDSDFLVLIQLAIVRNSAGSSLYDINNLLFNFFGSEILAVDNANMSLTYYISSLASSNLVQLFLSEDLLPAPMGVNVSVIIYAPIVNAFFGFVTYDVPSQPPLTRPFNNYDTYSTVWPWFSYNDIL